MVETRIIRILTVDPKSKNKLLSSHALQICQRLLKTSPLHCIIGKKKKTKSDIFTNEGHKNYRLTNQN